MAQRSGKKRRRREPGNRRKNGIINGPTHKSIVDRPDLQACMMGKEMTAAIGLNSWAAFADIYGRGPPAELASGFRAALNELGKPRACIRSIKRNPCQ